jgi:hypothetical protein
MSKHDPPPPPTISPYLFPIVLAAMGLWCLYDGWFSADPKMQEYLLFNRIGSVVLLLWAALDTVRTRRLERRSEAAAPADRCGG